MVLGALEAQTISGFEVIIVDNSSTDGTQEAMKTRVGPGPKFDLVYQRKDPQGPAAARNLGADLARAPVVVFLDSDVELAPHWLERALNMLESDPTLGAVGGQVRYANDAEYLNSFGGALSKIGLAWDRLEGAPIGQAGAPTDVCWMNCSAAMMQKAALLEAGGFDDRFFYAFEDSDIGWRMSMMGWRQRVIPDIHVLHHVGDEITRSSDMIVFHLTKNRLASLLANGGAGLLAVYLPVHLAFTLTDSVLRRGRAARLRALWWNVRNVRGTLARRRIAQQRRTVPDSDLLFADRLFPTSCLGGMRRRPNRVQSVNKSERGDDRV